MIDNLFLLADMCILKFFKKVMSDSLKILKTEQEYKAALKRTVEIFHVEEGTPESDELDILLLLVKDYEDRNFVLHNLLAHERG